MIRSIFTSFLLILSVAAYAEYDKNHKCSSQTLATMKSKAEKGDVVELHNMGEHYRYGYCSYSQDKNKAIELYEKAAVKGYVPSIEELITLHYSNKDYTKTREWCNKMLEINEYDADAYYYLALCEEQEGKVCVGNCALAAKYGNPRAMNKLGCIYYKDKLYQEAYKAWVDGWISFGIGAAPDWHESMSYITDNLIYCCLLPGNGCEKDYIAAARIYNLTYSDKKSYEKHIDSWNKVKNAADRGDAKACYAYYLIKEDKKYFDKALAANLPEALWEKELEKFEKKTENIDENSEEYEKVVESFYKTSMKNHWGASYIYCAYQRTNITSPFVRAIIYGEEVLNFSSYLEAQLYKNLYYTDTEYNYYWGFIAPKYDPEIGDFFECNTKQERTNIQKDLLRQAEDIYNAGIYHAARVLAWAYNDVSINGANKEKAFKYAAIAINMEFENVNIWGMSAYYQVGNCFYEGIGVNKNRTAALSYLLEGGSKESMELLNRIYRMAPLSKEAGVVQDIPLADYYLSESSKSGAELLKKLQNSRR